MQEWTPNEYANSDELEDRSPPRWYQHFRCKRYGRNFYINSPRIGTVGLHIAVYCFPRGFTLGLSVYQDEDGDWETQIGLIIFDIRIGRLRYWTKRRQRQQRELHLEERASKLADEVSQFLKEGQ